MSYFFQFSEEAGAFLPKTSGKIFIAVLLILALAVGTLSRGREKAPRMSVKQLAFSAAALALGMVTSNIKIWKMPMGGSLTLFSMFFVNPSVKIILHNLGKAMPKLLIKWNFPHWLSIQHNQGLVNYFINFCEPISPQMTGFLLIFTFAKYDTCQYSSRKLYYCLTSIECREEATDYPIIIFSFRNIM